MPRTTLVLFTPGPVRTPPIVAEYMADPPCNYHRQDGFRAMFEATEASVKKLVGMRAPGDYFATMLTSTGTACSSGTCGMYPIHGIWPRTTRRLS